MTRISNHYTRYTWGHGSIPPWFGIGPVYWGDQLVGASVSFGRHCFAVHKNLAQPVEENNTHE